MRLTLNRLISFYLLGCLMILAFVERTAGSVPLQVFHIEINKGYILLYFTIIIIVLTLLFRFYNRFDLVIAFLFIKSGFDLLPVFFNSSLGTSTYWYYFSMVISMPLIYFVFREFTGSISKIISVLSIFGVFLTAQVLITAMANGYEYSNSMYKVYMRIPFAHSNIIGAILLAILFLRIVSGRINRLNIIINAVLLFGLIIIQSIGSVLLLVGWFLIVKFLKAKENHNYLQLFSIVALVLIAVFVFIASTSVQEMILGSSLKNADISVLTSRRTDIWGLAILEWLKNPWLGTGLGVTSYDLGFEIVSTGVHNIVIDFAVQSGIVGVVLYGSAVIKGFRIKGRFESSASRKALLVAMLIILLFSMFEVCYFHYAGLFFFWMFMGLYNADFAE